MELIRVENITKTYRVGEIEFPVLKGVSFSIQRGEMVAIVGSSGSGKSTLMNSLGCLDRPTSGEYWLDGREVGQLDRTQRSLVRVAKLGFVFQNFNLLARTTAVNNVLMPLDYAPDHPGFALAHRRAVELLTRVGLNDRLGYVPSKMSGGQQQRVAIARSLINHPQVLLADEPTGNLDSKTGVEILRMFQELNAEGITIILVTHDPSVTACAHRMIRLEDGLVVEDVRNERQRILFSGHEPVGIGSPLSTASSDTGGDGHPVALAVPPRTKPREAAARRTSVTPAAILDVPAPRRLTRVAHWFPAPFRTAIGAVRRNKMRSALTTLGVVIGVAAVVAMVEISQGSRNSLMQTMATMGAHTLMVQSGAATSGGVNFGFGSEKTLTPGDADSIIRDCPAVQTAAPMVYTQGQVVRGNRNWVPMNIYGTSPPYLEVRDWTTLREGEMFTSRDVRSANKVCVIGETIARELFDDQSPLGQDLRIKNVSFRVVGVLSRKGANMMGVDQDDVILAPWTTIKYRISSTNAATDAAAATGSSGGKNTEVNTLSELYPEATSRYPAPSSTQAANTPQPVRFTNVDRIMVKARSAEVVEQAIAQITSLLRDRHRIRDETDDDFNIRNNAEMMKAMGSMSNMMGTLLLIVALISLVVGGVGIMNIMLVSVTERTREIGIRMAVGARASHILRQFLIEAVVLCVMGGIVGVILGRCASEVVWVTLRWPVEMSLPAIFGAFLISATVGIAFGFYPAWKASRLDPIDALRYE